MPLKGFRGVLGWLLRGFRGAWVAKTLVVYERPQNVVVYERAKNLVVYERPKNVVVYERP